MTDAFAVTVRREIAAPADVLFDAWLDAGSLGAWMKPGDTRETQAETDPRVGGNLPHRDGDRRALDGALGHVP